MNAPVRWMIVIAAFFAALCLPVSLGLTPDASWLLTVAERTYDGETLYRDILENNPPFSIWLYTLPAAASRLTGLASEIFLYLQFAIVFWLGFALSSAILRAGNRIDHGNTWMVALAWIVLFVLLPLQTFLQREHFATMALMPWLALQSARWAKRGSFRPRLWMIVTGGISCAVIVLNKPFYVPTIVLPVAALAFRQRSLRPFFHGENLIGAAIAAGYGAAVLLTYPDYFGALYDAQKITYFPVRTPDADVLFRLCAAAIVAALALWRSPRRWPAGTAVFVLAAIGHLAGTVIMGKTFTYHALPAMVLLGFACCSLVLDDALRSRRPFATPGSFRLLRGVAATLLVGAAFALTAVVFTRGETADPDLLAYLRDRHPRATYISVSPSLADSHPLVRLAGGKYVGPHGAMLVESYSAILIGQNPGMDAERRAAINAEIDRERRAFADAILARRPDILLVSDRFRQGSNPAWPAIAQTAVGSGVLGDLYKEDTKLGEVMVLIRVPLAGS